MAELPTAGDFAERVRSSLDRESAFVHPVAMDS